MQIKAILFDLDGVLVDTARFHFQAWRRLANSLGFDFSEKDNEQLKGVSRMESLELILGWSRLMLSEKEKERLAELKNLWYQEMIGDMGPKDLLPCSVEVLDMLKGSGVSLGIGSASRNAAFILERTGIAPYFEVVVDGHAVTKGKPHPEVFLAGASGLDVDPAACAVFEDAEKGLQAARAAKMLAIGIGSEEDLPSAHFCIPSLCAFDPPTWDTLAGESMAQG